MPFILIAAVVGQLLGLTVPCDAGTTTLASVDRTGTKGGNGRSEAVAMRADGRFVLFISDATNLVDNDANGTHDAFVRDLRSGRTSLVSVNLRGDASANRISDPIAMSATGRHVLFASAATNIVFNDRNETVDAFVRDLRVGRTTLVSMNRSGTGPGNGLSLPTAISSGGQLVAFQSEASDLVPDDTNLASDAFLRDLRTDTTTLVSVNRAGTGSGAGFSKPVAMSAQGRFVLFQSTAKDLVADVTAGTADLFVRDVVLRTTRLVTVNQAGEGIGGIFDTRLAMSANGRFVAFWTHLEGVVANDGNGNTDTFVRDLRLGTTTLASVNYSGTGGGNGGSLPLAIGGDRFLVFTSTATDLVPLADGNEREDVFVRDIHEDRTILVSVNRAGTSTGNGPSYPFAISANGRFVAFQSFASDLVPNDDNGTSDAFVRDLKTGATVLVSFNQAGTASANAHSYPLAITPSGGSVLFESIATDLVPNDTDPRSDVLVRDIR